MNKLSKEIDIGDGTKAIIYFRPPSYQEREKFKTLELTNVTLFHKKDTSAETQIKLSRQLDEEAYSLGQDIILSVSCEEWPQWSKDVMKNDDINEREFIIKYCFEDIIELGRVIVGGQIRRKTTKEEDKETEILIKRLQDEQEIENEQTKN